MNEDFLKRKLQQRKESNAFRELQVRAGYVDFCSNDYLGIVRHNKIHYDAPDEQEKIYGSTGSRLISGNYPLIEEAERQLAEFHDVPTALIFNSGYDANIGFLGCIPQRNDTVLFDQLSHASIRDGIRLSHAFAYSFEHNNVDDLERRLQSAVGNIFVVTESVFSMDGDIAPLADITTVCANYNAMLIVDEAHATGVIGDKGEGLVQQLGLQKTCFARIHTFGKALGCHGAVVLGSESLKDYLINFSRPFIYTTAMPASAVQAILQSYKVFPGMTGERRYLSELVGKFRAGMDAVRLCKSVTPIQGVIIPGNDEVKLAARVLLDNNIDVRPILYPTVSKGKERLRIVLHSFNTESELNQLLTILQSHK